MSRKILQRLCLTVLALSAARLAAQQPVLSPQATAEIALDGKRLAIEYGQPSIRGRKIMGDVVPYNKVWRTGTGKATTLVSTADFQLGDVEIPRGTYTLYTFPSAAQWKLIVNKQTGQWGTTYNADLDFARINLNVQTLRTPLENLTFRLERMQNNSGVLKIEWERTSLSVPFKFLQDAFVASPRDSTEVILQGKRVVVNYSRPSRRGRTIMGAVVPYGEVWRTGANEATAFVTDVDLFVGDAEVPRGAYTLYTLPSQNVWKLIINKETGQWGTKYDRALDLARVNLKKQMLKNSVERFTVSLERKNESEGILKLMWENTMLTASVSLKKNSNQPQR